MAFSHTLSYPYPYPAAGFYPPPQDRTGLGSVQEKERSRTDRSLIFQKEFNFGSDLTFFSSLRHANLFF